MQITQLNSFEAIEILKNDKNSILIDVRTVEEFNSNGVVNANIFDGRMSLIPWKFLPDMKENPNFLEIMQDSLKEIFKEEKKENKKILFMCKAGVRSNEASHFIEKMGYENCYNIIDGFDGWKTNNLDIKERK